MQGGEPAISLHYAAVPAQPWPALWDAWQARLPEQKRAAIARLRAPADRNASLLGLALLEAALDESARCRWPPRFAARAKPALAGGPDFSISHAAGVVGCAVAGAGQVGFDVERDGAATEQQLRLALAPAALERLASGALAATDAWVMTEAVLKAAGQRVERSASVELGDGEARLDGVHYRLARVPLAAGLVAWIAHSRGEGAPRLVRHEPQEFAPLP